MQGKLVTPDDRAIKLMALARLTAVIEMRCKLAGFYNPKVLERITLVQSATGQGVRWERLPFDEQLQREIEALRRDEDLRKREGLSTDPDN